VVDEGVLAGTRGIIALVSRSDGSILWKTKLEGTTYVVPTLVIGNRIYAKSEDLFALNRKDGRLVWIKPTVFSFLILYFLMLFLGRTRNASVFHRHKDS